MFLSTLLRIGLRVRSLTARLPSPWFSWKRFLEDRLLPSPAAAFRAIWRVLWRPAAYKQSLHRMSTNMMFLHVK